MKQKIENYLFVIKNYNLMKLFNFCLMMNIIMNDQILQQENLNPRMFANQIKNG
jgi:hypothetical protein